MATILVVEDEAIVAIDITLRLQRAGYDVPAAEATGEAALHTLEELHPDLVLMDVLLKGEKDGIETAREIKNQFEIPVVFLTGQADESTQERVKNTGAYGFILKPIDTASLLPTVELALARHAFEVQLKESEKRIRELTDALPVVVYETDATGRMTFVNATAFDLFGYAKEEIEAAMSIFQLIAPADLKRARAVFRRRMRGEEIGRVEYSGLRKDGSTYPISIRSALMKQAGAVVGQRGVILDFTELKLAEDEIKEHSHTIETLNCIVTEGNRATDVQSFAEAATNLTLELMHFDSGTIHLFDDSTRRARLQYATGIPDAVVEAMRNIPLDDAQYAAFLVELSPLFIDDCQALSLPHLAELGLESLAVVPLYHYDKRIGALLVGSFKRHTFSQAEKALLVAIGNEMGTVMANLRADEALKENERRIREITDALPVVVYETDATGRMTFVNATAFDLFGYTKEEIEAGMTIFQLIAPADRRRARALFRRSMSGGDVGRVEYTGLRNDGSTLYVSLRAALMRQDAAVVGLRGIIVDITERKKAEAALHGVQEELQQHATMFNAAHDCIVTLDPEGIITYWNRGAERLYGWTTQEAEGQNANALLRTRFPESREVLWPKLMESGLWEGELTQVTRDGVPVTVASSWTLMKDDGGNASAILEISSDVTERKKAELALAESEAKLRMTYATMADGIVITGLDEKVADCNEAILRLTRRSRDEILGKPFVDLLSPEFHSLIHDARKLLVGAIFDRTGPGHREKEPVRTDFYVLGKTGERVDIEADISLIEDASRQPAAFLIVARDVTERKRMEQRLDSTLADLQRSNAELEQFAYIASHDLQEPLRMITSYMQIIEEDYTGKLDADADQYIAFTVDGAKRMQTLIDDLLAYSRVGTRGEPFIPTSMNSVLSAAIANLEVTIEESHAVVTHDQLPTVLGDESQLIQLFQNLLGNAIKFRGDDAPMIHVGVEETKDGGVFSVRDNGIGIDMKYAERIFTVFQRLHARDDYPGTGIGLAVVKKIVERHGGRIWVESEPAKGSTFYFTLRKREDNVL
jgi:PAS domain S-box-containing protein